MKSIEHNTKEIYDENSANIIIAFQCPCVLFAPFMYKDCSISVIEHVYLS